MRSQEHLGPRLSESTWNGYIFKQFVLFLKLHAGLQQPNYGFCLHDGALFSAYFTTICERRMLGNRGGFMEAEEFLILCLNI